MRAVIASGLLALLAILAAACEAIPDYPNRPLAQGAANPPPADLIGADPNTPLILIAFSGGGSRQYEDAGVGGKGPAHSGPVVFEQLHPHRCAS